MEHKLSFETENYTERGIQEIILAKKKVHGREDTNKRQSSNFTERRKEKGLCDTERNLSSIF